MNITTRVMFLLSCLFLCVGFSHAAQAEQQTQASYTIKSGDNLTAIAKSFGFANYVGIVKANKIADPNKIFAGKTLQIPQNGDVSEGQVAQMDRKNLVGKSDVEKPQVTSSSCVKGAVPDEVGVASWYGGKDGFHGKTTASGEKYNMHAFTAAHRTLPFGTKVCIENVANGKFVIARVNDRGPFKDNRIIDVSRKIARTLGIELRGTGSVRLTVLQTPEETLRHNADASLLERKAAVATLTSPDAIDSVATENVVMPPGPTPGNVETHAVRVYKQFAGVAGMMAKAFPGDKSLLDIKRGLEEIVGGKDGVDVTPLAALIYLYKQGELSPSQQVSDGLQANTKNILPTASVSMLPTMHSDSILSTNPLH